MHVILTGETFRTADIYQFTSVTPTSVIFTRRQTSVLMRYSRANRASFRKVLSDHYDEIITVMDILLYTA